MGDRAQIQVLIPEPESLKHHSVCSFYAGGGGEMVVVSSTLDLMLP